MAMGMKNGRLRIYGFKKKRKNENQELKMQISGNSINLPAMPGCIHSLFPGQPVLIT